MNREYHPRETERLIAHKTFACDGFEGNYCLDGSQFEIKLPGEIGEGNCRSLLAHGSIQMADFNLTFNRDVQANGEIRTARTELMFCLGHGIEWGNSLHSNEYVIDTGESVLFHGGRRAESCTYIRNAEYRFLSIDMSPEQFGRMTGGLTGDERLRCGGGTEVFFGKSKLTRAIRLILAQIAECPYGQGMRELYLEGKMLELFAVYLNESVFEADKIPTTVKLSKDDLESLHMAKEILQRDYAHPPTLASLSRTICLNEFKLKKGFKEIFGYTVHGYVIEQRLQMAQQLLERGVMTVSEAASRVGYANVSHFAAAFRKKFGVRPGAYVISGRQRLAGRG